VNEGNYGLLTAVGKQELEGIGGRILAQYSEIFKSSALKVLTTDKKEQYKALRHFFLHMQISTIV
jgi:hypothetical protein